MIKRLQRKKLKASALFASVLVLLATLLFVSYYQSMFRDAIANNHLLEQYFTCTN